ncbi:MAG: DUF58 domain-containing protein [Verrucomicrobiales bacterium]|nr:DUF58 domain-containing protein [Verrucomicrobiales bacterium]
MAGTEHHWDFLDMGMVSRLARLEMHARNPMLGSITGLHKSATRGSSVEFAEYRKYVPGDDPKFIDWRVFGRTDKFFIREFEADTNLRCYLVVDTSASMKFSSGNRTRFDYARQVAATLTHLLIHQGDAVGLSLFADKTLQELKPKHTPSHLRLIYDTLAEATPQGETNIVRTLHELAERIHQRSLVVVISDLFTEVADLLGCFKHLRFYKHDVAVFHLLDRQEYHFDFSRPIRFVDMETGMDLITDPAVLREAYCEAVRNHLDALGHGCREFDVDYHLTYLDQSAEGMLTNFLLGRIRRKKGAGR